MGLVLAAQHMVLGSRVAIKVLLPAAGAIPGATERFLREARAAASLHSEHVARVMDVGILDTGVPFLVMEYLTGQDLREVLSARGPLPIDEVADYLVQVCDGMAEAHALGIVHRDLKPGNLFLTARPNGSALVKVLDFGLAKVFDEANKSVHDASLTATGLVIGSPPYMPPEQLRSLKLADARSDIWSLGVIMFELLTGKQPFAADRTEGLIVAIATDQPPPPRSLRPEIPEAIEALILRCLRKDPRERATTVQEIAAVMDPFARGRRPSSVSLAGIRTERIVPEAANAIANPMPTSNAAAQAATVPEPLSFTVPLEGAPVVVAATPPRELNQTATMLTLASSEVIVSPQASRPQKRLRWTIGGVVATMLVAASVLAMRLRSSDSSQSAAGSEVTGAMSVASAAQGLTGAAPASAAPSNGDTPSVGAAALGSSSASSRQPPPGPNGTRTTTQPLPRASAASPVASEAATAHPNPGGTATAKRPPNPLKEWN